MKIVVDFACEDTNLRNLQRFRICCCIVLNVLIVLIFLILLHVSSFFQLFLLLTFQFFLHSSFFRFFIFHRDLQGRKINFTNSKTLVDIDASYL